MEGTTPPSTGYQEFYTCVARVSELPRYIALSQRPGAPYTEAQVRAYYAQFPIGKVDTDGSPCYAQHWRIPDAVLVAAVDGYEGDLQMAFPLPGEGQPTPKDGIDGLGTADVSASAYPGGIPNRYLLSGNLVNEDGSIRYNAETDIVVRDEAAGFDLIIQKNCPDVGGRMVSGVPIDRAQNLDFSGTIPCDRPQVFESMDGVHVATALDNRVFISYYIWPKNIGRIFQINRAVHDRLRSFLVDPFTLRPITATVAEG